MADVQLEHGYTRIANELLEALARAALPGRHFQVMLAMVRQLYGFNRSEDRIASSQIAAMTGLDVRNVRGVLADLVESGLLQCEALAGRTPLYRIQKDHEQWSRSGRPQRGSPTTRVAHEPGHSRPGGRVVHDPQSRVVHDPDQRQKDSSQRQLPLSRAPRAKKAGPIPAAIAAFCEEYKAARDLNPAIPPRDKRELGEAFADLGEERFRAAAREFFDLEDDWIKQRAFSSRAFLQALPKCDLRAQSRAAHQPPPPTVPLDADQQAVITSLFGGSK